MRDSSKKNQIKMVYTQFCFLPPSLEKDCSLGLFTIQKKAYPHSTFYSIIHNEMNKKILHCKRLYANVAVSLKQ